RPSLWRILPLKEVSIGFLFAAGAMVGLLRSLTSAAIPAWTSFAALCVLNCVSIAVWESDLDSGQRRISIATAFPGIALFLLPSLVLLSLTSLASTVFQSETRNLFACVAVSAISLAAVHVSRKKIQSDLRTALADLVLLTPVPLFIAQALT
ncbi:MAG: hypothetical protein ACXWHF_10300, partial [Chthoniobacterales bacterium]